MRARERYVRFCARLLQSEWRLLCFVEIVEPKTKKVQSFANPVEVRLRPVWIQRSQNRQKITMPVRIDRCTNTIITRETAMRPFP